MWTKYVCIYSNARTSTSIYIKTKSTYCRIAQHLLLINKSITIYTYIIIYNNIFPKKLIYIQVHKHTNIYVTLSMTRAHQIVLWYIIVIPQSIVFYFYLFFGYFYNFHYNRKQSMSSFISFPISICSYTTNNKCRSGVSRPF